MCAKTHYCLGSLARTHHADEQALETHWIQGNFQPKSMNFDQDYNSEMFRKYLADDIEAQPIPARRHNKNLAEFKHRVIRKSNKALQHRHPDCLGPKTASPQTLFTRRTSSTEAQ
eukprot:Plantae.Rhodophyta-Rhodochaete_pulchella.ctg6082.p1 GENE.Plantae.Rhodophyta-Rhodochaete_pulchella.ctg6082~~Plantae.Rhodophyta-Rhodochaete_pulchella.ctg6082.p1  ORF type:complete len:115 (+),score=13.03 Plantae.Rhodophyta-Rhodochaete_pulchella.ctg6082:293-637(+)